MTLKVTQGHRNCLYAICHFLLVVDSNDDFIWHSLRDITTLTMYVTGYDLEKSILEKNSRHYKPRVVIFVFTVTFDVAK